MTSPWKKYEDPISIKEKENLGNGFKKNGGC